MSGLTSGDWLLAIATIIGAVIGIIGTLLVEHFRKERQRVRFIVGTPEDLAEALRRSGNSFELRVGGVSIQTVNASPVTIQNYGNVQIVNLTFDVSIPGEHSFAQLQPSGENPKLVKDVRIREGTSSITGREHEPLFAVSLPFLNPGEAFKVTAFYDGPLNKCAINCRLPGVRVTITTQEIADRSYKIGELAGGAFGWLVLNSAVVVIAAATTGLLVGLLAKHAGK